MFLHQFCGIYSTKSLNRTTRVYFKFSVGKVGNNRSVMPLEVLGGTRITM